MRRGCYGLFALSSGEIVFEVSHLQSKNFVEVPAGSAGVKSKGNGGVNEGF
jgi:hypothetical protein